MSKNLLKAGYELVVIDRYFETANVPVLYSFGYGLPYTTFEYSNMMEENKDCKDVITQLSAASTAINRTIGVVVSSNHVSCVRKADKKGKTLRN